MTGLYTNIFEQFKNDMWIRKKKGETFFFFFFGCDCESNKIFGEKKLLIIILGLINSWGIEIHWKKNIELDLEL